MKFFLSEQGDAAAQYSLAVSYAEGKGVLQSDQFAYAWSSLAASNGSEKAKQTRDGFAAKLTPQQLWEAQELAAKIRSEIDRPPALLN